VCSSKLPKGRALVTHSPYILPKCMFINLRLLRDVVRNTARVRLRGHNLRFEAAIWSQSNSLTCDLFIADDVQRKEKTPLVVMTQSA